MNPGTFPYPPGGTWDPKGAFNPVGPLNNPGATVPFPLGSDVPVGCWFGAIHPLVWGAGVGATVRQAIWTSPIFDLRPEIRAAAPAPPTGNGQVGTQALWRGGYGAGGQLYVQVSNLQASADALTDIVVNHVEFAHVSDPLALARIIPAEDITEQFSGEIPSALIIFQPPGSGYPVRYWQCQLTFNILIARPDPPFVVAAAYY